MPDNFVDQEFLKDVDGNVVGDCWRACLANLLGRPRDKVPHFVEQFADNWLAETQTWLWREYRQKLLWWPPTFPFAESLYPHVILLGKSPREGVHAVLADAMTGDIVHDPHPSRAGLLDIDGVFVADPCKDDLDA